MKYNFKNRLQKTYIFKGMLARNRKGSAYWFIYAIAFAFILAILYIVFGQILNVYLYPTSEYLTGGNMTGPQKFLDTFGWVPYIIVLIIVVFLYFRLTQSPSGE